MKPRCLLALLLLLLPATQVRGQQQDFAKLFDLFRQSATFTQDFPREKVYLHLDNNAYFEGDTIWYKAYVVNAASLRPEPVSSVLYVELLNANGQLVERNLLRVDSTGQANGETVLELPFRRGYYEIRAYTREMTNWGVNACFSRVVPVFVKKEKDIDFDQLETFLPEKESDLMPNHPRPFLFPDKKKRLLSVFPEGGQRIKGTAQYIAYQLTDHAGRPLDEVLTVMSDGKEILQTRPMYEGRGKFLLPANASNVEVVAGTQRFSLFQDEAEGFALTVSQEGEAPELILQKSSGEKSRLLGIAVLCREEVCYFDTLTVGEEAVALELPPTAFHGGVNRVEIFDVSGRSLCSRLVWKTPEKKSLNVEVRQSRDSYEPFSPIALEMHLKDEKGKPVEADFSLSVREETGILTDQPETLLSTDLLLSSEIRGYVHQPDFYFTTTDKRRLEALDLLLMVQGWTSMPFSVVNKTDSFELRQPIEDKLTLNGRIYKDNDKRIPLANMTLNLKMFSREGGSLEGTATTDEEGRFAFQSNVDYCGNWIAQITTLNDAGKRKWSRVALDRWFSLPVRAFSFHETNLQPPVFRRDGKEVRKIETFSWNDTIRRVLPKELSEAVVSVKKKYKGLTGGRYSYGGGERTGMRKADIYYNVEQEVERLKDRGEGVGTIWDLLASIDNQFDYDYHQEGMDNTATIGESPAQTDEREPLQDAISGFAAEKVRYRNRVFEQIFLDNDTHNHLLDDVIWADEIKSAAIMHGNAKFQNVLATEPGKSSDIKGDDALFLYSRPDYMYYKTKRGVDKRMVQGYSRPLDFYAPKYNGFDLPSAKDLRRTLYWNPNVKTDKSGKAIAVFYSNAREGQYIHVSLRGITAKGEIIEYEY